MVSIEMLTVGKELLIGRTVNTNAHWVGGKLARLGTMLRRITTVDDNLPEISGTIKEILARSPDFVVTIGGLGPTPDDMTIEGISMALELPLELNSKALALIRAHYRKRELARIRITSSRKKMARMPRGAEPLRNDKGTAPGVRVRAGSSTIFSLPGVPSEMKSIFTKSVEPEIRSSIGSLFRAYHRLKIEGIFESDLAPQISREISLHPTAYVKSHPRGVRDGVSRIELDIAVVGEDRKMAENEAGTIRTSFAKWVNDHGGRFVNPEPGKGNNRGR